MKKRIRGELIASSVFIVGVIFNVFVFSSIMEKNIGREKRIMVNNVTMFHHLEESAKQDDSNELIDSEEKSNIGDEPMEGEISKAEAILIATNYGKDVYKYGDDTFDKINAKYLKSSNPSVPNKWIVMFGDLNKDNVKSEEKADSIEKSLVLYIEIHAVKGSVLFSTETDKVDSIISINK